MGEVTELGGMRRSLARIRAGLRRRRLILTGPDQRVFLHRDGVDHPRAGIYLHRIHGPDPGLDLHDHPWPFVSIILRGGYDEEVEPARTASSRADRAEATEAWAPTLYRTGSAPRGDRRRWRAGSVHRMPLDLAHRIVSVRPGTVTLVLRGRRRRVWGFYQPDGWVAEDVYDYRARRPLVSSDPEDQWNRIDVAVRYPAPMERIELKITKGQLWRVVGDCGHETVVSVPLDGGIVPLVGYAVNCEAPACAGLPRRIVEAEDVTEPSRWLAANVESIEPGDTFG